ncbi:MAG: glycyl radical protein [Lachnospiraceae bacterium]|nr:glycyl radical protein [Lachnospiraceae bacterium]
MIAKGFTEPTARIKALKDEVVNAVPEVEPYRAVLITESYKETEGMPMVIRRAKANEKIFNNLPVVIRDNELIVGALSVKPRSTNLCPEFSYDWVEKEFKTMATRMCDPFVITEETADILHEVFKYWKGKTTSELATSYMSQDCLDAQAGGVFTVGNYYFGGIGHVCVDYGKVLKKGFKGVIAEVVEAMGKLDENDPEYLKKRAFYEAVIISYNAAINFAKRYSKKAAEMAASCTDPKRKAELELIARNCDRVPENGATNFYEACQSFWFVQALVQIEANGHSISPGRFDQYMWPYLRDDKEISKEFAQELIDCIFVLLNHVNKTRDEVSDQAFAGYAVFQNFGVGGQTEDGLDATNPVSYMCMDAAAHVRLPAPSFSVRIHNQTPDEFLLRACELSRLGMGVPAFYNDEAIIPALCNRGLSLADARNYCIIGCVEPQCPHKTDGWHDAAFFNVAKVFDIAIHGGKNRDGKQLGPVCKAMPEWKSMDDVYEALDTEMRYFVAKLAEADNAVDVAHRERAPLPFMSALVDDCIARGKTVMEGGAHYNFTGPQAFGNIDTGDAVYAIRKHVFEDKDLTMQEIYEAMEHNFGAELGAGCYDGPFVVMTNPDPAAAAMEASQKAKFAENGPVSNGSSIADGDMEAIINAVVSKILAEKGSVGSISSSSMATEQVSDSKRAEYDRIEKILDATPCFGNDIDVVDMETRKVTQMYSHEVEKYKNPRGGNFQAGCYPVSANVLFGKDVQALPDGRYSNAPLADGVSPRQGHDVKGPTAAGNSVAKLDQLNISNGTLYNQKFLPSAVAGDQGLMNFAGVVRNYFDKKGMHVQFNVIDRETLLDAQAHPSNYKDLVVRVAGYSAHWVTLAKEVQDDIIARTEQTF